jgi:hypothetical protein
VPHHRCHCRSIIPLHLIVHEHVIQAQSLNKRVTAITNANLRSPLTTNQKSTNHKKREAPGELRCALQGRGRGQSEICITISIMIIIVIIDFIIINIIIIMTTFMVSIIIIAIVIVFNRRLH